MNPWISWRAIGRRWKRCTTRPMVRTGSGHANWLSDEPLSAWAGVRTNGDGRVTWLELVGNRLRGVLPAALGNLTALEGLLLKLNWLHGPIPSVLGRLSNLEALDLSVNELNGGIPPELGNLANLEGAGFRRESVDRGRFRRTWGASRSSKCCCSPTIP